MSRPECSCDPYREDMGGGYYATNLEPDPDCPEHFPKVDHMATPPLDLPALHARIERAKERPVPPGLAGILALDVLALLALLARTEADRESVNVALDRAARNHARAEGLARELSASGGRNIDLLARAEAAEKKVAAHG